MLNYCCGFGCSSQSDQEKHLKKKTVPPKLMTMTEETSVLAEASILPGCLTCSAHLSKNTDWSGRILTDKTNLDPSLDQIIADGSD